MEYRASFQGTVIARSTDTILVEGNRYFPAEALTTEYFSPSSTRTLCLWKGLASYYSVTVDGVTHPDAAWYYPHPTFLARRVKGRVAFRRGVQVNQVH